MLQRCQSLLDHKTNPTPVKLVEADICDIEITNASLVVMNFTLQFIPWTNDWRCWKRSIGAKPGRLPGNIGKAVI